MFIAISPKSLYPSPKAISFNTWSHLGQKTNLRQPSLNSSFSPRNSRRGTGSKGSIPRRTEFAVKEIRLLWQSRVGLVISCRIIAPLNGVMLSIGRAFFWTKQKMSERRSNYKCRSQVVGHARLKFELQKTEVEICIVTPLMETCCSKNTPVYLPVRTALEADMCLDTVHFDFKNI